MRWAVFAGVCVACGGTPPSQLELPYDHLDGEHASVVHLSSDCSGTLVAPDRVLTAAHCVGGERDLQVRVDGTERVHRDVLRCQMHPGALPGRSRPCGVERRAPRRAHDLAMLKLSGPVPRRVAHPYRVALSRPSDLERVLLVAWFRHPFAVGTPRRYRGWNRVVQAEGAILQTLPDEEPPFRTRMGSSGGPALRGTTVVGVLHGGERADSPDSVYVATYAPANRRWLSRMLR